MRSRILAISLLAGAAALAAAAPGGLNFVQAAGPGAALQLRQSPANTSTYTSIDPTLLTTVTATSDEKSIYVGGLVGSGGALPTTAAARRAAAVAAFD